MNKRRQSMMVILAAALNAVASTTVTLYPVADADIRSFTSSTNGYDRMNLVVKNAGSDPSATESAKAYVRFKLPDDFGAAVSANFSLGRAVAGAYNFTYGVNGLSDGVGDEISWAEANGIDGMSWNNAPGNVITSPSAFDNSSVVGSFTVIGSNSGGSSGDRYSISGSDLSDFLNEDSNGYVTLMVGRSGVSTSSDLFFSRSCDAYDAPRLVLEYVRAPQSATLYASGDATVKSDNPSMNFGGKTKLFWSCTSTSPYTASKSYIRFRLPDGAMGNILSATLKLSRIVGPWITHPSLYVLNDSADGLGWGEMSINWTNAPANITDDYGFDANATYITTDTLYGSQAGRTNGEIWEVVNDDIVDALNSDTDQWVTFMVEWSSSPYSVAESFASTENIVFSGPILDITYMPADVAKTSVLMTTADSTIKSASPDNNYGLTKGLQWACSSDSPYVGLKNYFRFELPPAIAGNITSAVLRLTRSSVGPWQTFPYLNALNSVADGQAWDELDIVWTNAPANITDDYGFDADQTTLVAMDTLYGTQAGHTNGEIWAVSNGLVEVLNADADRDVTFMVEWGGGAGSFGVAFASKEHVTMTAPVLELGYTASAYEPSLKTLASKRWHAWRKSRSAFPAAAWSFFARYAGTPSEYQVYRDAGLSMVQSPHAQSSVASAVGGLNLLLGSWENIWKDPTKLTQYLSYPTPDTAVAGYVLYDEPPATAFPALAEATENIYRFDDRNAIPIVDHFPNWAVTYDRFGLGDGDGSYYETYINKFVEDVSPCVLMNCHYPILVDGSDRPEYYSNIEYFRHLALENDIGLLGFVRINKHLAYREPSESDLNWMAYGYLAYGAHGLFYWNYRIEPADGLEEGMVLHSNGTPRAVYYLVQDVNEELSNLWPVLRSLRSTEVFHVGTSVPADTVQYVNGYLRAMDSFTGTNCILGEFINQDDHKDDSLYVMVVNKNHGMNLSSAATTETVTFSADNDYPHVFEVSPMTGEEILLDADASGNYTLTLGGGKGALLRFMPEFPSEITIVPAIDTYIHKGNPTVSFDSSTVLIAQNSTAYPDRNRKIYMKFVVPENGSVTNVAFEIMPASIYNENWQWNYTIYGLKDGVSGDDWVSVTWNNAPANDPVSGALFTSDATGVLCQLDGGGLAGVDRTASSQALVDFIQSDSDGIVTLMMVRSSDSSAHDTWGALETDGVSSARIRLSY